MSQAYQLALIEPFSGYLLRIAVICVKASCTVFGPKPAFDAGEELSLKGKRIAISATGTDHFFDLQAYNAQIEEVKILGGEPIAVDAGR
ncbi:hypothetical protein ACC732_36295, partial [Rhizobium ruizarguesonis]